MKVLRVTEIRTEWPTARGGNVHTDWVRTLVDVDEVDPVVVSKDGHQLIDGRHRLAAAVARGDQHIECVEIDVCDELEALVHSALANAHRSLPLTTGERRALVGEILRRAPEWADRRIAGVAGVSPTTVGTVRRRLVAVATVQNGHHRVGRDGRTRAYAPKAPSPDGPAADGGPPTESPAARRGRWLGLLRRLVGSILAVLRRRA